MIYSLFIIAFFGFYLYRDFARDKGEHTTAKAIHAILLVILALFYVGSISNFIRFVFNFSEVIQTAKPVGLLSENMRLITQSLSMIMGVVTILTIYSLLKRNDSSRQILIKISPVLAILGAISLYILGVEGDTSNDLMHWPILIFCLFLTAIFYGGVMWAYSSKLMRRFFAFSDENSVHEESDLEALIDHIGTESPEDDGKKS